MYIQAEITSRTLDAVEDSPWCKSVSPDGRYCCTLTAGHVSGIHKAGVDLCTWIAFWDDNRETDPPMVDTEYFASIGL